MIVLDLFCGAGGAARGYHDALTAAGIEPRPRIIGVDNRPQPNYPYIFVQADAFAFLDMVIRTGQAHKLGLVHASPPCQFATAYKRRNDHVSSSPNLIPTTRDRLEEVSRAGQGVAWVIENVPGARAHLLAERTVELCGSSFGLDVRRHRLFELSPPSLSTLSPPPCNHGGQTPRFPPATNRTNLRSTVEVGVWRIPLEVQRRAMGIDWMERHELSQAIPPAYTRWIAERMIESRLDRVLDPTGQAP